MNNKTENNAPTSPTFVAWIGLDWGDKEHAFSLATEDSSRIETGKVLQTAETLHAWLKELETRFGGRPVALAVEAGGHPLLDVLAQYAWLEIYPVNPLTSARYRTAFRVSGAKDDVPDSGVLLELVRLHREKLTRWEPADEQTHLLDTLVRIRRDWVDRRTQCLNQLTSLLKAYFPQALQLVDLGTDLALDFLSRWPDILALKAAQPASVKKFYHRHNLRRPELLEQRLELIKNAVALTTNSVVLHTSRLQLKLLVEQTKSFNTHIAACEKEIAATFKNHEDAALFRELPGAGPALAPRLLAGFGSDRSRYGDAASMQKYVGVAPVKEKSGSQLYTHWRWRSPVFLRQTFIEWAGQTVIWSSWAAHYYERMKAKKKKHHVILRALAFKWIRILWKCWQTRVPYSEATYLRSLKKRKSPNLPSAKTQ
jgi:transposase